MAIDETLDGDWTAVWELTCQDERDSYSGGFREFVRDRDGEAEGMPLEGEITVGDVRFDEDSDEPAYLVDVEFRSYGATQTEDLRVVKEDGAFRICE